MVLTSVPAAFDETPRVHTRPMDPAEGDSPRSPVRRPTRGKIATTSAFWISASYTGS